MKAFITIILLAGGLSISHAQIIPETPQTKFEQDIKYNRVSLYILGGITASVYKGDAEFQQKYKITFYDFGCLAPSNIDFYKEYNKIVFEHLNKQYDTEWQDEIRKDILGWLEWKKKK